MGASFREPNMAIAFLNGDWMQPHEAKVSVFDRGFMFGDGVYEVMPVYGGRVFTLAEHVTRLQRSLGEIRLATTYTDESWTQLINDAVSKADDPEALVYLQVTRGVAAERSHVYPDAPPTVLITVTPAAARAHAPKPLNVVTKKDFRWHRADIKVTSLIANGLIKNEALAEGFDDAILVRGDEVTEGTASNVFIVTGGVIKTPPKSNHLLHGITRDLVLALAGESGLPVEECLLREPDVLSADEVWLTSTGLEVCPVGAVNGQSVGNGEAGVVWAKLDQIFQAKKTAFRAEAAEA